MASEEQVVVVRVVGEGIIEATTNMDAAAKSADALESSASKSSVGAKSMGIAFKGLAHEVGISGAAAKLFGHEVSDVVMALGAGASALGILALGAIAATKVVGHFTTEKQKEREETVKSAEAAMQWVDAARIGIRETDALREANEKLWKAEKDRAEFQLEQGIKAETETIAKLSELIDKRKMRSDMDPSGGSLLGRMIYGNKETRDRDLRQAKLDYDQAVAEIGKMYTSLDDIRQGNVKRKKDDENQFGGYLSDHWIEFQIQRQKEMHDRQKAEGDLQIEQLRGQGADEFTIFAQTWANKLEYLRSTSASMYEIDYAYAMNEARLQQMQRRQDQQTLQNKATVMGGISQVMDQAYALSGKKMKAFFYFSRGAAAAEAFINYEVAAAKAVGQTGPFGMPMEAYFHTMAKVVPAMILAQSFMGEGAGGGGGAVGTYSANPNSGIPENGYKYFNYEQSNYGSGWKPGTGPVPGNTTVIYAMDSKDVTRVLMDNAGSVKAANDFALKGYA